MRYTANTARKFALDTCSPRSRRGVDPRITQFLEALASVLVDDYLTRARNKAINLEAK